MNHLKEDFGTTAFIAALVLIGSFILLSIGAFKGLVDFTVLVGLVGSWVGSIITAFVVIKSAKKKE